ncbi:NHLP bacteriocin export ABC transporter permease/ATPase subunit [Janthinobacterium fluminis]|uniref:NHLP bacteriocin export ABC transporter permease/ATPase subunit n=1 Tax=Janthinobacterium fluminis TaxID=2987524 RepID=A0ABT5K1P2_9BURK|nr:NHLP bacteriocin export ABC transporter permease/ATPase subunit [Janthinobacterium fluminis]MDC8758308.1 NHLP bacteriocin export ABC transporter permease/ATPase subunit [Janthinobacterium fluminis]
MNKNRVSMLRQYLQRAGARPGGDGDGTPAGGVWLVEQGQLNIFMVSGSGREHLCSVDGGQIFVFPAIGADAPYALVAAPSPQTRYWVMDRQAFAGLLDDADGALLLAPLIDPLLLTLARPAPPRPRGLVPLAAGGRAATAEQALPVGAQTDGLWMCLSQGQGRYLGRFALPPLMPLPLDGWLQLDADSTLACLSTPQVCAAFTGLELLEGIETWTRMALLCAMEQTQQNEIDELNRLQQKTDMGRRAMADALGNLATLFERPGAEAGAGGDALLGACRLIGQSLGLSFNTPAGGLDGGKPQDAVKALADAAGVRSRSVALKGEWWRKDNGPLLVFTEAERRPLALLPLSGGRYQALAPGGGDSTVVDAEFAGQLSRFAYMFYRKLPSKKLAIGDILGFMVRGIHAEIAGIALIGILAALLGIAIPIATGHLFDTVFPAAEHAQMLHVVAMLFVASVVNLLFEATRSLLMLRVEGKASSDLQAAVWDRVLKLPMPFFRDYAAGDLALRINGINEIRQALSGTVIASLVNGVFSILNIFLMFYYSPTLGALALLLVLVAMAFNVTLAYFRVRVASAASALNGLAAGRVLEYLSGIAKLRMTGSEGRAFANWSGSFAMQKRLTMRAGTLANMSRVFSAVFPLLCSAAIFSCLAWSGFEQDRARLSTGDFIAFSAVFTLFMNAMLNLVQNALTLVDIAPTYQRTRPILETLPEVDENKADPGKLSGAIELSNVSFAYAADAAPILRDISLSIRAGEFVALVGASGSGKSTLLRLLLGFETPSRGAIYYDAHNLKDVDVGAVRRQLGVVLQGGRIMNGDIFTNIIGSSTLSLAQAWEAARACGLDEDIQAMPMGMHTLVGDGGGTLSGGQRQRLLIARAIARQPGIIYFDEATSALDNQTQAVVSASMEKLRATRVVIAHRLSTVMNADRIFVLEQGRVVQSGTYQELMQQAGLFSELAKRQIA